MCCLDSWAGAAVGIQIVPTGGAEYTIDYSFDNPNDLINPIPLGSMFFDTTMCPGTVIDSTTGKSFEMPTAPIWGRLRLINATGAVRATWLQVGDHSRSNIGNYTPIVPSGPNAPPPDVIQPGGAVISPATPGF